jgi:hypothetical protein
MPESAPLIRAVRPLIPRSITLPCDAIVPHGTAAK